MATPTTLRVPRYRRKLNSFDAAITIEGENGGHAEIISVSDDESKTLKFNSKSYTATSGNHIGFQTKPNQTGSGTADITGAEFSPRYNDAAGGTLSGIKVDPVIKDATTARTVGAVRAISINFDLPNAGSAYTITNDVSAVRIFPDFGSGHTFSGDRAILLLAAPNTSDWTHLLVAETGTNGWVSTDAGTYSTADGYFLVKVHGTERRVPFFNAVD